MSNVGGFFCSKPLPPKGDEDPKQRVRQYAFVWGRAIKDADDRTVTARCVTFYIKYGEERDRSGKMQGKFLKCQAKGEGNAAAVMAAVEKGDVVLCFGRTVRDCKTTKKGEKCYYYMTVDVILPMEAVAFLLRLCASGTLQKMLDAEDNEAPDAWESD